MWKHGLLKISRGKGKGKGSGEAKATAYVLCRIKIGKPLYARGDKGGGGAGGGKHVCWLGRQPIN